MKDFPDKGWTKSSINRLLKKFRNTGTVDRRQAAADREVPARMKTLTRDVFRTFFATSC